MSFLIELDKYYNIPESSDSENYIEYGRELRKLMLQYIKKDNLKAFNILKDDDLDENILNRYIDYIIKRIINLGINILKISKIDDSGEKVVDDQLIEMEKEASNKFLEVLEDKLNLENSEIVLIHKIAYKICSGYINENGIPSKGEKKFIKLIAKKNLHKCYICARNLEFESKDDEKRTFCEIEHIYPRVYGGSRSKTNLTVCCENCNKIKDDMISSSDFHFESFISSSSKEENIKRNIKKNTKLSLILKQNLTCVKCEKKFFHIDNLNSIYLIKKEEEDVFHYFNAELCCEECYDKQGKKGVKIELQL